MSDEKNKKKKLKELLDGISILIFIPIIILGITIASFYFWFNYGLKPFETAEYCSECGEKHSSYKSCTVTKLCSGCNTKRGRFHECYFCEKCNKIHDLSRFNGPDAISGGRWCRTCCKEVSAALGTGETHCCNCGGEHLGRGCQHPLSSMHKGATAATSAMW